MNLQIEIPLTQKYNRQRQTHSSDVNQIIKAQKQAQQQIIQAFWNNKLLNCKSPINQEYSFDLI